MILVEQILLYFTSIEMEQWLRLPVTVSSGSAVEIISGSEHHRNNGLVCEVLLVLTEPEKTQVVGKHHWSSGLGCQVPLIW